MTCPSCKKREASIHITQSVNGKTTRIDLCPVCAREQGYIGETGGVAEGFFGLDPFGGTGVNLFKMAGGVSAIGGGAFAAERCAYCGTSFDDFRNRGLLGCCHCYEEFDQRLLPVIRRIQAGETHIGRRPARLGGTAVSTPPTAATPETPPAHPPRRPLPKRPPKAPKADAADAPARPDAPPPAAPAAAGPAEELARLRREQAEAVQVEDYEKAARIRDRIRALEPREGGSDAPGEPEGGKGA